MHAVRRVCLGVGQRVLQRARRSQDAAHIGARIGLFVHRVELHQEGRRKALHTAHLVEDKAVAAVSDAVCGALVLVDPEIIGVLVCRRQAVIVISRFEFVGRGFQPGQLLVGAGIGEAVDLVILVLAAQEGQLDRAELQLFFIPGVKPGVQLGADGFLAFGSSLLVQGVGVGVGRAGAEDSNQGKGRNSGAEHRGSPENRLSV